MNPIALRLLNQQLLAPRFGSPADVVSHMGAVQAQEYRLMRWAVAMRTRKPSLKAFKNAFDRGDILRLHLMRGTWQLVSARDYWPFLTLCAPKALAVIKGWMSRNKISLPEAEVILIRDILTEVAAAKGSATKDDFALALQERGIAMDDHRLSYHIRMAELSGVLCSGDLLPMKASYALTAVKVGPKPDVSRSETLALLARKYFQSRQPATFDDFLWWTGLNVSDCREGIALLGSTLRRLTWKGREFFLTDDCRTRGFRADSCLLIPPYDEYLIGYKSRDIVLPPDYRHRAHNNSGIFQPVIAHGGVISGNWAPFRDTLQADFFLPLHQADVSAEWARYKAFQTK
ncbi:MAG: AlkZ family DNA glycosylase [Bacteroidaceae bacterium]|nr:AlkZ family DNA glycosylase [Bacteroidaceae bacterium]